MIDKKFSTKLVRSILRRSRGISEHTLIHPERDWFIGLGIASVILIFGIIASVNLYFTYTHTDPEATDRDVDTNQIYRANEIKRALNELEKREEQNRLIRQELEARPVIPAFLLMSSNTPEENITTNTSTSTVTDTTVPTLIESGTPTIPLPE